jgi:hypothetical protein
MVSYAAIKCNNSLDDSGWALPKYDEGCSCLMNLLHQEWSGTDGELTFIVARKMIWALLLNPNAFYKEFSPDTTNYQRFVKDIDKLVFWNPTDTATSYLENLRIISIERLTEQTYSINDEYLQLHQALIDNIKNLKVTHVD